MPEALVDGVRIEFEDTGSGEPIVLLHGGMDDRRSWRWQLDDLCDTFRVVAWDAPGCGHSADPPAGWRMPEYADCLATFVRSVGIDRANVVGLSWGSSLALQLYGRHPDLVASLVLASTYLGWAGTLSPEESAARVEHLLAAPEPTRRELLEEARSFVGRNASSELLEELVGNWLNSTATKHPVGYRTMIHSMVEADLRDIPPGIDVPTLLVHGAADQRAPLATAEALHRGVRSSRLVVIPHVGHLCNAEAPESFNTALREFLASTPF